MKKVLNDFPNFNAVEYASQGNAVLGIRDSGKTVTAVGLAERLIEAGIPVTIVDPIGRWRFMRVAGKGKGYPVVVAGGTEGDLPLSDKNAADIVRAAMQNRVSIVLDLYTMKMSKAEWRRIMVAALEVMLYENPQYGLRHIFIEEAAEFCPQIISPDTRTVYDQVERLARMGGNALLGYTLINQRSEQVNKAVLELCDNLILHRAKGKNSLLGLNKWLAIAGTKGDTAAIMASLPNLAAGRCWAWMRGSDQPLQVQVPMCKSFIPDRRSVHGAGGVVSDPATLEAAEDLVAKMRDALEKAAPKKPAPAAPAARGLERLANNGPVLEAYDKAALKQEYDRGYGEGHAVGLATGRKEAELQAEDLVDRVTKLMGELAANFDKTASAAILEWVKKPRPVLALTNPGPPNSRIDIPLKPVPHIKAETTGLVRSEKVVLTSPVNGETMPAEISGMIKTLVDFYPLKMTWSQLCTLQRIVARGGSFNRKRKLMVEGEWVLEHKDRLVLGDRVWNFYDKPESTANAIEQFLNVLPQPASDILRLLVEDGPHMPAALAQRLNRQPVGGSWNTAISTLKANGLIAKRSDGGLEYTDPQQ